MEFPEVLQHFNENSVIDDELIDDLSEVYEELSRIKSSDYDIDVEIDRVEEILNRFLKPQYKFDATRLAVLIGKTHQGRFSSETKERLVVKFDFSSTNPYTEYNKYNIREGVVCFIEETICSYETDSFCPIHYISPDFNWLIMPELTPLYSNKPSTRDAGKQDYIIDHNLRTDAITRAEKQGWSGLHDSKHGNIGLNASGTPVYVDYGSYVEPSDEYLYHSSLSPEFSRFFLKY